MLIALDYDGTYTADPELWDSFIQQSRSRGHEVIIATMRFSKGEGDIVRLELEGKVDAIIFTERKAKKTSVWLQYNRNPDIWIDDNPDWLYEDAQ